MNRIMERLVVRSKYYDIANKPYKWSESGELKILRVRLSSDGNKEVFEDNPSEYERASFWRNMDTSCVLDYDTAFQLALNPALSY